ncbi:MAG: phytanoyl-CoA dioxygenase family protein [Gemmatimonadota bacterium]|nr:phytanoyl-CoA dioxygenase family protein [Gemmatimonadota bacterium]
MADYRLGEEQIASYRSDGYLIIPDYFPPADMELLLQIARADQALADNASDHPDVDGKVSRLSLRAHLPESAYSSYVRHRAIVEPMEQLLDSEVYHYHHKMMLKEPRVGGAWEWHQDYGYWYVNFLYADLASCMIAVDRATRDNGCLQVLKGSHRLGRIDHGRRGKQTGADPERVEMLLDHLEVVYCEMAPGTVLFFDCNLLHRSDPNESDESRWALICCYNSVTNPTLKKKAGAQYEPLEKWEAATVREAVRRHGEELQVTAN